MYKTFIVLLLAVFISTCVNNSTKKTKVIIHTKAPVHVLLTISRTPYFEEKKIVVDSVTIINNHDSLILYVPRHPERLYNIDIAGQRIPVTFINDANTVMVYADYFNKKFKVIGSAATASLNNFENMQLEYSNKAKVLADSADYLIKNKMSAASIAQIRNRFKHTLEVFFNNYITYADTVKSPAAFIKAYNSIDFEKDYIAERKFIYKARKRFAGNKTIQRICKEALETADIYEQEINVGDRLPEIELPSPFGLYSTKKLSGKYYLIDFWSTYCNQCYIFKEAEKKFLQENKTDKFEIVSVAIDDQKELWQDIIVKNKYEWPQLIDIKMWQGEAVRKMKFDSIPFNFLVSPTGKVLAKDLKGKDLGASLKKYLTR